MKRILQRDKGHRHGAIAVLAAVFIIVMLGMVAFAVDIGYLALARTRLQAAADGAALAASATTHMTRPEMEQVAKEVASKNMSDQDILKSEDIEYGIWDAGTYQFTPTPSPGNAVRVTVRTSAATGGATPLFFGRIFGLSSVEQSASAIATVNPRDICFVVDLAASMNYDTRPDMADSPEAIALIQGVYDDFGFGSYPGPSQYAGYPLTGVQSSSWLTYLKTALTDSDYKNTIYFTGTPKKVGKTTYYYDSDGKTTLDDATRTARAYAWVIDIQIGQQLMPNAVPTPNSTNSTSFNYWKTYIDWRESTSKPYNYTRLGYKSYLQYMMYLGRDGTANGYYTVMSVESPNCHYHPEATDGGTFDFPASEQPTHAARRSIIAALKVVKDRNASISDPNQRDWVSIVTFDTKDGIRIVQPLTQNYDGTMLMATKLQACASGSYSTATETGMIAARNHIKPQSQGGQGREHVNKIVVLLTDGAPNLRTSGNTTINNYKNDNPSPYWIYPTSTEADYCMQASIMQASMMQSNNWYLYPVGLGLDVNSSFMDKMALMAVTADKDGHSFSSTDSTKHEENLRNIFNAIISRPKLRIVQ